MQGLQPIGLGDIEADGGAHPFEKARSRPRPGRRGHPTGAWSAPASARPASADALAEHLIEHRHRQASSSATRACSAATKSSSPFIERRVIALTSASPRESASSSMHSTVIMVESMSLTRRRLRRSRRHDGDVEGGVAERRATRARDRRRAALDRELAGLGLGEPARPPQAPVPSAATGARPAARAPDRR